MKLMLDVIKRYAALSILAGVLLSLNSCMRYRYWVEDVFNQSHCTKIHDYLAKAYIRSIRVYDQANTLGIFDALWLHPEVTTECLAAYASLHALDPAATKRSIAQELMSNKKYISFYVLGTTYNNILLNDELNQWHIQLLISGVLFKPVVLNVISLRPEYRLLFGKYFNRFKQQYIVSFNAYDEFNNALLQPTTQEIKLVFKRLAQKDTMCWQLDNQGLALPPCSFNRNILAYDINNNL